MKKNNNFKFKMTPKLLKKLLSFKRKAEGNKFLYSEEGEKAEIEVESLCNQLGISLESDQDDDDDDYEDDIL